jgi:hypothetical protein
MESYKTLTQNCHQDDELSTYNFGVVSVVDVEVFAVADAALLVRRRMELHEDRPEGQIVQFEVHMTNRFVIHDHVERRLYHQINFQRQP